MKKIRLLIWVSIYIGFSSNPFCKYSTMNRIHLGAVHDLARVSFDVSNILSNSTRHMSTYLFVAHSCT